MINLAPSLNPALAHPRPDGSGVATQSPEGGPQADFALLLEAAFGAADARVPAAATDSGDASGEAERAFASDLQALAAANPAVPLAPELRPAAPPQAPGAEPEENAPAPAAPGRGRGVPAEMRAVQRTPTARPGATPLEGSQFASRQLAAADTRNATVAEKQPPLADPASPGQPKRLEAPRAGHSEPSLETVPAAAQPDAARPAAAAPVATAPAAAAALAGEPLQREEAHSREPDLQAAGAPRAHAVAASALPPLHAPQDAAPPQAAQPMALHIVAPLGTPEFGEAVAARVSFAIQAGAESASIRVTPPELGPVAMSVSVLEGEAHVHFAAESAPAREALAEALPRLREMLAAQGLALAGSSVGGELPRREPRAEPFSAGAPAQPAAPPREAEPAPLRAAARLVDTFA